MAWTNGVRLPTGAGYDIFRLATASRPALGSTQPHSSGYCGSFHECKRTGTWSWALTSI